MLPTREQFHQMSDDQVIQTLKLSGAAARVTFRCQGIEGAARAKSENTCKGRWQGLLLSRLSQLSELPM